MNWISKQNQAVDMLPPSESPDPSAWADGGPLRIPERSPATLVDAFLRAVDSSSGKGIIFVQSNGKRSFRSYSALLSDARHILSGLRKSRLKAGDRVILQLDSLVSHFAAFWGAVLGGIVPVTVAIPSSYRERSGITAKLFNSWNLLERPPILTTGQLKEEISRLAAIYPMPGLKVLPVDGLGGDGEAEIHPAQPDDIVFLQLTSGSTGVPKCIQETHRGIIAHIHGSAQFNGYTPSEVSLNWLPVDHVVPILTFHLKDVYLGCQQIHVRSELILGEPLKWLDLLEEFRVTHTWAPNFAFKLVADRLAQVPNRSWELSHVRFFMNAGEQVTAPVVGAFLDRVAPFGIRAEAMQPAFGMAEACTCMTYQNQFNRDGGIHWIDKGSLGQSLRTADPSSRAAVSFVDLGPPIPGVQIRITDSDNQVLPERQIGRLQIKGDVVTPGYVNNPEANREAFVGDGWFNSGDLGFISDGRLTLTGREKEMIIIRGANFYCYEIEDVVNEIEGVAPTFAAACAVDDVESGSEALAVFYVPRNGERDVPELVRTVKQRVASTLGIHPRYVIALAENEFPKTTSGKIQRGELKKRFHAGEYASRLAEKPVAVAPDDEPRDETEMRVRQIWQEVLRHEPIGLRQPFFELGDSLRAAQVLSRVGEAFQVELSLGELFSDASTISGMAERVRQSEHQSDAYRPIQPVPRDGVLPVSHYQQRIWLLEQVYRHPGLYHVPIGIWIRGRLDRQLLEASLNGIIERHEILRTIYRQTEIGIEQVVTNPPLMTLEPELIPRTPRDGENEARRRAVEHARAPFDLTRDPPVRMQLLALDADSHLLVVTFHQIAIDIWSLDIFVRELATLYEAGGDRTSALLPELKIQYGDFAAWLENAADAARFETDFRYWQEQLKAPVAPLDLPADGSPSEKPGFSGETLFELVPAPIWKAVQSLAQRMETTAFQISLAAYALSLHELTGQTDLTIGTAAGGRPRRETENLIGFFANTVPLRLNLESDWPLRELIRRVRQTVLDAHAHQSIPFDELIRRLRPPRPAGRSPLFQTWFALNERLPEISAAGLTFQAERIVLPVAQFELTLFLRETARGLCAELEFDPERLSRSTSERVLSRFCRLLARMIDEPDETLTQLVETSSREEVATTGPHGSPRKERPALGTVRRKSIRHSSPPST